MRVPQIIVIVLLASGFIIDIITLYRRRESHTALRFFWTECIKRGGTIALLLWGGFFK